MRSLLALSWVFFIAAIAHASAASLVFNTVELRDCFVKRWDEDRTLPNVIATLGSLGAQSLPTGAFLVASWAISFYVPAVGWVAFGFVACFGFLLQFNVFVKAWQVCLWGLPLGPAYSHFDSCLWFL